VNITIFNYQFNSYMSVFPDHTCTSVRSHCLYQSSATKLTLLGKVM